MLLAEIVATSARVASTTKRTEKVATLVETLRRLEPDEVVPAVAFLTGEPRQGRISVGYRTLYALTVTSAAEPSIAREVGQIE